MRVRFQADADLKEPIVLAVKRSVPEINFQTATAAGLEGLEDPAVLSIAAQEGRVMVSHDRRTMPYHFGEFITNKESAGLIVVSQRLPIVTVAEELVMIWATTEADEWINQIKSLPL